VHTHGNGNYTVVKFDKNVIISNFEQELFFCFVKSSTDFITLKTIFQMVLLYRNKMMLENASLLLKRLAVELMKSAAMIQLCKANGTSVQRI
jgi:hypothetical protein